MKSTERGQEKEKDEEEQNDDDTAYSTDSLAHYFHPERTADFVACNDIMTNLGIVVEKRIFAFRCFIHRTIIGASDLQAHLGKHRAWNIVSDKVAAWDAMVGLAEKHKVPLEENTDGAIMRIRQAVTAMGPIAPMPGHHVVIGVKCTHCSNFLDERRAKQDAVVLPHDFKNHFYAHVKTFKAYHTIERCYVSGLQQQGGAGILGTPSCAVAYYQELTQMPAQTFGKPCIEV